MKKQNILKLIYYWTETIVIGIIAIACLFLSIYTPDPIIASIPMGLVLPVFLWFCARVFWFKTFQEVRD